MNIEHPLILPLLWTYQNLMQSMHTILFKADIQIYNRWSFYVLLYDYALRDFNSQQYPCGRVGRTPLSSSIGVPDTARIQFRNFTPKRHRQLWVKAVPDWAWWRPRYHCVGGGPTSLLKSVNRNRNSKLEISTAPTKAKSREPACSYRAPLRLC